MFDVEGGSVSGACAGMTAMDLVESMAVAAREIGGIGEPGRRAAVERWMLEFTAENVHLNVGQAMVAAGQLARRYGHWAIVDERNWERLCRVPLRSEFEWSLDGLWPADFARPILVPGSHGEQLALFLPEDVPGAALDERVDPVGHREVGPAEIPVPDFAEFAHRVGERERRMFGRILECGGLVRWEPDMPDDILWELDLDDLADAEHYDGELSFLLNVNPHTGGESVMRLVLGMLARLVVLYLSGALGDPEDGGTQEGVPAELDGVVPAGPLELDLIVWLAARRLRLDILPGPAATEWLLSPAEPAPGDLSWALVYDVADGVEGIMLGHRYRVND